MTNERVINLTVIVNYLFHNTSQHILKHMCTGSRCSRIWPHRLLGSYKDHWNKDSVEEQKKSFITALVS